MEPVVVAAVEPVPVAQFSGILGRSMAEVKQVLGSLALFFPERNGCIEVWHKSVRDWLTDPAREGEEYWVDEREGHRLLAQVTKTVVQEVKMHVAARRKAGNFGSQ